MASSSTTHSPPPSTTTSSTAPSASQTLQQELARAIRAEHTALNRLLSTRLPLCLPPHTTNPFIYTQGLSVVRHLYTGFEYAWETLLSQPPSTSPTPPAYLSDLRTPNLSRHLRLSRDVHDLTHLLGAHRTVQIEKLMEQTIHFHKDTFKLCLNNPHLVLAYAWTLYLAIFNGGRFIRAELERAGPEFWGKEAGDDDKKHWPLEFWHFAGDEDGADVEAEFKARFDRCAEALSREEKDDVVREAKRIFGVVEEVVGELDRRVVGVDRGRIITGTLANGVFSPLVLLGGAVGWVWRGWLAVVGACWGRRKADSVHLEVGEKS